MTVDPRVLTDARARLVVLRTNNLVAVMNKRRLEPLAAAVAELEAGEKGVVEQTVLDEARALVVVLEREPPSAELAPAGTHATTELIRPTHIDQGAVFGPFMHCKGKATLAVHDYKYLGGAEQPWRNGVDDSPVTDEVVIASEEEHKLAAEAEDEPATETAHAERLRGCGVRVDFLLALTFALDMWGWKTWEVVQYLVKPATEAEGRCRFADLGLCATTRVQRPCS